MSGALSGASSLSATTLTGTLSTASQPNITSFGTLTSLAVSSSVASSITINDALNNNGSEVISFNYIATGTPTIGSGAFHTYKMYNSSSVLSYYGAIGAFSSNVTAGSQAGEL